MRCPFVLEADMTLDDTIKLMQSDDYKDRFVAEYWQTKIRYDRLHKICVQYEAGTLGFEPKCTLDVLSRQASHMGRYLKLMEIRAEMEGIEL